MTSELRSAAEVLFLHFSLASGLMGLSSMTAMSEIFTELHGVEVCASSLDVTEWEGSESSLNVIEWRVVRSQT